MQVAKSYSPDKSAEFAGGLVQIAPLKLPNQPLVDFSYGVSATEIAELGRALNNTWRPQLADGAPGQNWGFVLGNRFDKRRRRRWTGRRA